MPGADLAPQVRACLAAFTSLLEESLPNSMLLKLKLSDQKSRFSLWSANIGAHRKGTSSLDYRLRDASHIKLAVGDLLKDLDHRINDAVAIMRGDVIPWDQLPDDDIDNVDSYDDSGAGDAMPDTELEQIVMDIEEIVGGLLKLSMLIRDLAPHDRFFGSRNTDTSHYEPFDIQHVQGKFEKVDSWLVERLGNAITRRRQYFKYRKMHHDKLSYGMGVDEDDDRAAPSTMASSLPGRLKDDTLQTLQDDNSDDGLLSQTSFATSVQQSNSAPFPPLPVEAGNGPFECQFCYTIINVTDRKSWKKHIFQDLRPYVCLERDCKNPSQEFTRRHEWIDHTRQNHWTTYRCPGCVMTFLSAASCKAHFEIMHSEDINADQLNARIRLNSDNSNNRDHTYRCPLCNSVQPSLAAYERHVGRHQEQLALFALPSAEDQPGEEETAAQDTDSDIASEESQKDVETWSSLDEEAAMATALQASAWEQGRSQTAAREVLLSGDAGAQSDTAQYWDKELKRLRRLHSLSIIQAADIDTAELEQARLQGAEGSNTPKGDAPERDAPEDLLERKLLKDALVKFEAQREREREEERRRAESGTETSRDENFDSVSQQRLDRVMQKQDGMFSISQQKFDRMMQIQDEMLQAQNERDRLSGEKGTSSK